MDLTDTDNRKNEDVDKKGENGGFRYYSKVST